MTDIELGALRGQVQDLAKRSDWSGVLALAPRMRSDSAYWIDVWAPLLAVAACHVGDPSARSYLDLAIAGGFSQPETMEGELERCFGTEPDWPAVVAAMAANVPPPEVELLEWPELSLAHPVSLAEIAPDRVDALRERLPRRQPSAWDTARQLLAWVSAAWDHSGSAHVEWADAIHVLDRVADGERFACKEYTVVLSQALNANGVPARSVTLLRQHHHSGFGRAHAVSEAWIDDLDQWVLLDGQNGMFWSDGDGRPLGLPELRGRQRAGEPPPGTVSLAGKASANAEAWWPYFHNAAPTGMMISSPSFAPILEQTDVLHGEQLRRDLVGAHPDLLELAIGATELDGKPAIQPVTRHPHTLGFEVSLGPQRWRLARTDEAWPIPTEHAGDHVATVGTITEFGAYRPHPLRFRIR